MTWVTPRVWVAGERVSATKMNEISTDLGILFPYTTAGDLAFRSSGVATLTRLSLGTAGYFLKAGASAPEWASLPGTLHTYGHIASGTQQITNSTTLVDVTAMTFDLTLTKTCTIFAFCFGIARTDDGVYAPTFSINIDGTDDPDAQTSNRAATFSPGQAFTSLYYRTGIASGTRNVKLKFKIANATDAAFFESGKMIAFAFEE